MKHFKSYSGIIGIVLAVCLILGTAPSSTAQKVPITFDEYHGYEGTVDYLKKVSRAYSDITELIEIGKSSMGRSIYVLVISNMRTGTTIDKHIPLRNMRKENVQNVTPMKSYHGKPGHWIDGGTHGNEYTGTEVCLYSIDKLVSGYGSDSEITKLIDDNAFYICPIVNPDGVYNSVEKGMSQRQNSMLFDDDKDGKINEDGPDDLNGDGHLTQFRYKDPEGRYVMDDQDPRLMVRLGREEETTKERYSVIREDKDNDGDGQRGEDSERGIDLNRNYPEGWFNDENEKAGTGFYPSSAPETKTILEYFTNNTNIFMVQSFHTSGGFTYRPFARWPDSRINAKDLAIYDKIMGKKYLELIGEEVPAAWSESGTTAAPMRAAQAAMRRTQGQGQGPQQQARAQRGGGQSTTQPRGWRHPYNDQRGRPYGYGIFMDWAFAQFGAYSMSTELWNQQNDLGLPEFSGENARTDLERAVLKHQDDNYGGRLFVNWTRYNHPELGEGEIGGWIPQYRGNAWPGDPLRKVIDTHWQFELFKAGLLPNVQITDAKAKVLYTTSNASEATATVDGDNVNIKKGGRKGSVKIVEVTATIENTGKLQTQIAGGERLAGNRQDAVWLIGDRDKITYLSGTPFMRLGVLDGTMEIPGISAETPAGQAGQQSQFRRRGLPMGMPVSMMRMFMQQSGGNLDQVVKKGNKAEVKWLIAVEGNAPIKIVVTSQKGGTKVKDLSYN
ncbi:M14 family metallopeptidase [candidate division KSB1 bacterium]